LADERRGDSLPPIWGGDGEIVYVDFTPLLLELAELVRSESTDDLVTP